MPLSAAERMRCYRAKLKGSNDKMKSSQKES